MARRRAYTVVKWDEISSPEKDGVTTKVRGKYVDVVSTRHSYAFILLFSLLLFCLYSWFDEKSQGSVHRICEKVI